MNRSTAVLTAIMLTFHAWPTMQAPAGEIKLKIVNPEPETDARFGWELTPVGSDGNILVASPASLVLGGSQGAAYLINAHDGDLLQTYRSPSGLPQDFGRAVAALNKNGVLIAGIDNLAAATGTLARFYHFDATTGSLVKTFAPPNRQEIVSFGQQIEVEGDGILVGASQSSVAGPNNSGAVYLLDAETGKQLQRFLPPSPITFGFFGDTIAFAGENVIVGFGEAANKTAEAYVFSAITGDLLHTFSPPDAGDDDLFGFRVAADGNNILVGAALDDTAGPDAGAAYLFDATTGDLLQSFFNPTPEERDFFGASLAIRGDKVLVAANQDDSLALDNGAVYMFDATSGDLLDTFLRPEPVEIPPRGAGFGHDIAFLDDEHVVISDLFDNTGADRAGAVYVYQTTAVSALVGDCNGDSLLNASDLSCVSSVEARDAVLNALNTLPGDLDGNGDVSFDDFVVLSNHFGTSPATYAEGDIDIGGGVDFDDFVILSDNFGQTSSKAAAVPESAAATSLAMTCITVGLLRRRV